MDDVRYGLRSLARTPALTAVALLTLALGIGANTAIFSFVDALWLQGLPVPQPSEVVRVFSSLRTAEGDRARGPSSWADFVDLRAQAESFQGLAAAELRGALVDVGTQNRQVDVAVVSDDFFECLRVAPIAGRTFKSGDSAPAVLLSEGFWRRQFHGDRSLIGRSITVDNQAVVALGVLPRGLRIGSEPASDLWIPMRTWERLVPGDRHVSDRGRRTFEIYGRLRGGIDKAAAEVRTIAARLAEEHPDTNAGEKMTVVREAEASGEGHARVGALLLGTGLLVLLIACANVSSLLLARSEQRRREIATRLALGATRGRLVRQLLIEGALLAGAGSGVALLLASSLLEVMRRLIPAAVSGPAIDAQIDPRALLVAALSALGCVFVFALAPALQATEVSVAETLKGQPRGLRARLRSAIVAGQIALSLVLVCGTALLVRTVMNAQAQRPGFDDRGKVAILAVVPGFVFDSVPQLRAYADRARAALEETPGVAATALASRIPFEESGSARRAQVFTERSEPLPVRMAMVGDRYFQTIGTRLLQGREFDTRDTRAVVVNATLARRLWPGENPIGKRMRLWAADGPQHEVIGVAEDGKYVDPTEDAGPYLFVPFDEWGEYDILVRTRAEPAAMLATLSERLRAVDRAVPMIRAATIGEHMGTTLRSQRTSARLVGMSGVLGLLLAASGLYGLMAFLVGARTREIGIRIALGAGRARIFALVVRNAISLAGTGIAAGLCGSIALAGVLRGMLYGVSPFD
ncbi:MAG: ADOP family duplicated permease, partial [Deltaproteobacteria bacterium]